MLCAALLCFYQPATLFAMASLVFPIGFQSNQIGGKPYKLPEHTTIGYSYILFNASLLLIFVGELFAMKLLCPGAV
eukprot:m.39775 g.39775  ORF g.39775 m.39775 type:complete len:76 (-) comp5963_c0_seq2:81-308(-)